ncbi:CCA tRNA nucleotidyltransferase [Corticimicrobacter populi]|uniref:CCA tRNA nucleotidyltransferase n=1 Tax=Corticimicrobacter populi TaxID=2175229 RepID=A0A2V1JTF4_9BURK|nr:CCA tRNA nucleotidyltransferase [Corticimicrobacter populi]PWF21095.1 CCA tRNA nucleotidyltransferase [Corticimicrobacter populi]
MQADPLVGLQVYAVGGVVRDGLLGLQPGDHDWVVVGTTPEEMARRGFLPVGGDFPVFLHPQTHEEYALARTERKSGRGYRGFTFHTGTDVSLADDLRRRDLTVNAIARDVYGQLYDPLGGAADVEARIFRHVGEAFMEDPVRILRLARFMARFVDFSVAPETLALCRRMVDEGEVDALVPERVWQELSRGLISAQPARMLALLAQVGALERIMPGLGRPVLPWQSGKMAAEPLRAVEPQDVVLGTPGSAGTMVAIAEDRAQTTAWQILDAAAQAGLPQASRYALLVSGAADVVALSARLRVPSECADMARLLQTLLADLPTSGTPEQQWRIMEYGDALRKPARFEQLLDAAALCLPVDLAAWQRALAAARLVDAGAIARQCGRDGGAIKDAVRMARVQAIAAA